MGKRIERLTSTQVRAAEPKADGKDKLYSDGGGLFLRAGQSKSGETTRNWFFKYTTPEIQPNGRHYEPSLGLGSADTVSLADARQAARDADRQRREAWRDWKPGDPRPANDPVERNRLVREARKATKATEDFRGSNRYFRGRILDELRGLPAGTRLSRSELAERVGVGGRADLIDALAADGLVEIDATDHVQLPE